MSEQRSDTSVPAEAGHEQPRTSTGTGPVPVDLALQGGGAHGACSSGVLDRLLEKQCIRIDGISGTSAGAMTAAVLASGFAMGGADGAREALTAFWRRVSEEALLSPLKRGPLDILLGRWTLDAGLFIGLSCAGYGGPGVLSLRPEPHGREPAQRDSRGVNRFRAAGEVELGYSSKLNAEWAFLTTLRDEGRIAADAFLARHGDDLGKRDTLDLDALLEGI